MAWRRYLLMAIMRAFLPGLISLLFSAQAAAVFVSAPKAPEPFLATIFPEATHISEKITEKGRPPLWTAKKGNEVIGYAFETDDVMAIPAYSGETVNLLVAIDTKGIILDAVVLEHHEPILLVGIPEQKLFDFAAQYRGLSVNDAVKVGGTSSDTVNVDAISGATVTVMVVNISILRTATKVARALGIIAPDQQLSLPPATIRTDIDETLSWEQMVGDGSIRRLHLTRGAVDDAFVGTDAEKVDIASADEKQDEFIDLYYALANVPSIGKSLLGEREYRWIMQELKPGEHVIALMGNGYSFKGSGYVRGGIFDRVQINHAEMEFNFRDTDQYRINDLFAEGVPDFYEMSLFIVREHNEFDPGKPWELELLVRRQTGPIDSVFTSFKGHYQVLDKYLDRPEPVAVAEAPEDMPLWKQVWLANKVTVSILIASLVFLTVVIFLQDWLVRYPLLMHSIRKGFLIYTVLFIGGYAMAQLSVVNVFTFVQSLMGKFNWETFLLDPMIFVLWVFVAFSVLLWGRGIFCGWLCPFGALQELLNEVARKFKIYQIEVPFAVHERLWALKYIVLLVLFGLSLESLQAAEKYAEIEPFKTVFLLRFDRELPFVLYASALILIAIFNRKFYCRYVCPLGAAIAIPSGVRLFDWLRRRKECGHPCQVCAIECEIQAITPTGEINLRECHHCLDCQVTYYDKDKCPPLVKKYRRQTKAAPFAGKPVEVKVVEEEIRFV